jgi:hypothetical protein
MLDNKAKNAKETHATNDTIYLHWTWPPRNINRTKLRAIYNGVLKEHSGFTNLIITYETVWWRPNYLSQKEAESPLSFLPILPNSCIWWGILLDVPPSPYKLQPPQKKHWCYLHSALRYFDEAPRNFLKKKIMQQPYPLPCQNAKLTLRIQQVRATWSWSFAYQGPYAWTFYT